MGIEAKKLRLIEQIMHVNQESTLKRVQDLLKQERIEAYKANLHPTSIEELEEKLSQSEQDIHEGNHYDTQQVREHFAKKRSNG